MFRIRGSIGFGIFLFILWIALPQVFGGLNDTLVSVLSTIETVSDKTGEAAASTDFSSGFQVPTVPTVQ